MINKIKNEIKKRNNFSITENGAVGYKTTNSALVDLNYQVSSLRNAPEEEIALLFTLAFHENRKYALKWLFFARDVREGLGERRLFRICYRELARLDIEAFYGNLHNIAEYGRWDDLVSLLGISNTIDSAIGAIIKKQLDEDYSNFKAGEPVSLLAKWLPSENASSKNTKKLARKVIKLLDKSPKEYRLLLSSLRKYSNVVEVKTCNNEWSDIDYEKVPSLANLKYKDAFIRHDEHRRVKYLDSVSSGKSRINMKVATPVDIVSRYSPTYKVREYDETLELAWKNLKDIMVEDTLVVADGSGSMTTLVSGKTSALDVANSLAIYTAEHNSGVYRNKYITFSSRPQFVDLPEGSDLRTKLQIALEHDECSNTNIEAVFDLILDVAIENEVSNDEMVKNILIISDMEFDRAQTAFSFRRETNPLNRTLFDTIRRRYWEHDYDLPKLIFWNVNSRTKTIPLIENDLGVVLVSGFSQDVLRMVMSAKYSPYDVLIEFLDGERYDRVVI